jgi:prevent-host-death family protein
MIIKNAEVTAMKIHSKEIVSSSDIIKNYRSCREKAEDLGKIVILKNNQPDAVLIPFNKYEKISSLVEQFDECDQDTIEAFLHQSHKSVF